MCSTFSWNCLQSLIVLCVSVRNSSVMWHVDCNAWPCAAISLLVSPSRSPLDSHKNGSSSLISCLSILLIYWPSITLLLHFFSEEPPHLLFMCWMSSLFVTLFSFDWFNSSAAFATILIIEFIFGWLLLTMFTNWSSAYFMFRYSAVLIISALCLTSICNRPLPPSFHFTYGLLISAFGWCILKHCKYLSSFLVNFSYFF